MTDMSPLGHLSRAAACLLLAASAHAAVVPLPQISVEVATRVGNEMANDALASDGTQMFGRSSASPLGATATVVEGVPWSHPCATALCGSLTNQVAYASGEINTDLARFKAFTSVSLGSPDGAAQTLLRQSDVVTFNVGIAIQSPQLSLHLAMDSRAGTSGELRGYSLFEFSVHLSRLDCPHDEFPDGCSNQVFYFQGADYAGRDLDNWYYTGQGDARLAEGTHVPDGGLDIVLDLLDLGGHLPQIGALYGLDITSRSYSECGARTESTESSCSTYLDAGHTAYVGITGLGTSTYSYPGAPANRAPEPASLPLVLAALGWAALGARRGRRTGR